jgi:hypothetical protein
LIGGGYIDFWSLEQPDRIRGHHYRHVLINEAAMVARLTEIIDLVINPTLLRYSGGLDLYSTPKGLNDFFRYWQQAIEDPEWKRFHFTTYDNPFIPKAEIDRIVARSPERVVKQEIKAEFIADGSYFQNVDAAAVIEQPEEPEQHVGHYLVMGCDWALSEDYTVFTIACRECNRVVDWQRFNNLDFTYQRERLVSLSNRWNTSGVLPERNSIGEPNIELLRERVPIMAGPDKSLGFLTTATSKPGLIQALANALEHDGFQVPRDYADELRSYEVEMSVSNHPKFSAPSGQHDDRVISLALCWWAMTAHTWWIT